MPAAVDDAKPRGRSRSSNDGGSPDTRRTVVQLRSSAQSGPACQLQRRPPGDHVALSVPLINYRTCREWAPDELAGAPEILGRVDGPPRRIDLRACRGARRRHDPVTATCRSR
jgi:hypothetical protein